MVENGKQADVSPVETALPDNVWRNLGVYPLPAGLRILVVVPVYNERNTAAEIRRRQLLRLLPSACHSTY